MGSDNCNNFFNIDSNNVSSSPFYQTLGPQASSSQSMVVKSANNEWIGRESAGESENQENDLNAHREQHLRIVNENQNCQNQKSFNEQPHQHLQMSIPQWSFPAFGNNYQRSCSNAHYGIVIAPNAAQQAPSLHSINGDIPPQIHAHSNHQMQTNQHLKKIYYQGLICFIQNRRS